MKTFKLLCSFLLAVMTLSLSAQEAQFSKANSWAELLQQAKKEHKMVFIDSYFVGCHPCKQMDDEVFPLPQVVKLMGENFISVKIDFLKDDLGKQLQIKYGVTGFPTFLLLNSEGQLVSRFSGYQEADKFQSKLSDAVAAAKKGQVMAGFNAALDVNYPDFYRAFFTERKAINAEELSGFLSGKDMMKEADAMPFLMSRSLSPEWSDYLLKNYRRLESMYGKELTASRRNAIIFAKLKNAVPVRNDVKFEAFLNEVKPLFSSTDWPYAKLDIAEEYFYRQQKDRKAFFRYAAKNYNDDDNKLRYMAMYLSLPDVDAEEKKLYAEWMKLVVQENSSYAVLASATSIMKNQEDMLQAKRYARWGLKKAALINKSDKMFQSVLD